MNYVTPTNYLELVQGYMGMLKAHFKSSGFPKIRCIFLCVGGGVGGGSPQLRFGCLRFILSSSCLWKLLFQL